jgi:hypothetical protein
MASNALQTTWLRPALIIFAEKEPQPIDEVNGIWDLGGDDRQLTIVSKYRKDNTVILQLNEDHGLTNGDEIVVDGLDGDFNGSFTVLDANPGGIKSKIKYSQIGSDSGDNFFYRIGGYKRKDNYATFDIFSASPHVLFAGDDVKIYNFPDTSFNGTYTITEDAPDDNTSQIQVYSVGPDTGDGEKADIIQMRREDNQVTLKFDYDHPYEIGDTLQIRRLGDEWTGSFVVTDNAVDGDETKVKYTQKGPDTLGDGAQFNVVRKRRESGSVTLQFDSAHSLSVGNQIKVEGLGVKFNNTFTVLNSSVGGDNTKIRYIQSGPDTGDGKTYTVSRKRKEDDYVTLTLTASHVLFTGDMITVSGLGSDYDGTFRVTNHRPANSNKKVRYIKAGPDLEEKADTGTVVRTAGGFIEDNGLVTRIVGGDPFITAPMWYPSASTASGVIITGSARYPYAERIKGGGPIPFKSASAMPVVVRVKGGGLAPDSGTLTVTNQDYFYLTDDNRSDLAITNERIEYRKRMINGRMRSYHVADKKTFSVSWKDLETSEFSISEYIRNTNPTPKRLAAAKQMVQWYNDHKGSFYLVLVYDSPDAATDINIKNRLEYYEVFFESFNYTVKNRGRDFDLWDVTMTLVEA